MTFPVGIDLGTTTSVISVYRRGKAETLRVEGNDCMPSAVCYREKGETLVGNKALNMALIRPESTVLSVKRNMGKRDYHYNINGTKITPVEISAKIIEKLCVGHEKELGGKVTQAVITVPAYFTDDQKKDTRDAAIKAGLDVLRLLPEPTAAAIAIGLNRGRDQTILVYDLGGGTFDISILRVEGNSFKVIAVNGDHDLGGNDFDRALCDHFLGIFKQQKGIDLAKINRDNPNDTEVRHAMQTLMTASERIKKELAFADNANLDLPSLFKGNHLETIIDRTTFEGLIKHYIYKTRDLVLSTVKDAQLELDDIDQLYLVGGSTKIPLVRRVLTDTVREPFIADYVDLAVSHGAAIMAASIADVDVMAGGAPVEKPDLKVQDVLAHPISIGMLDEFKQMRCYPAIKKNTPLPAEGMQVGFAEPGKIVGTLPIFRGDHPNPNDNTYLGDLTMTFERSSKPIFLRFELRFDESGILHVDGCELDTDLPPVVIMSLPDSEISKLKARCRTRVEIIMRKQ